MGSRTPIYVAGGLAAAAIVAAGLVYAFVLRQPPVALGPWIGLRPSPTSVAVAPAAPVATPSAVPSAAPAAPKPEAAPAAIPTPAFDVVRIEPNGDTVVAGRAAPGAAIVLSDDNRPIGDVVADAGGQFVILPPALAPGRHPLRLSAQLGGAAPLLSDVYVAEVAGTAVAANPPAPAPVAAASPSPAAPAAKPTALTSAPQPATTVAAAPSPAAVAPSPASPSPAAAAPSPAAAAPGAVVVASVRPFDPAGLEAEGSAPPGARLRLRLNDTPLADAVAGPDGKWRLTIERGMTPGGYVLEADIVGPDGATLARADAPFAYPPREAAAVAAATPAAPPGVAAQASPPAVAAEPSPPASALAAVAPTPSANVDVVAPSAAAASPPAAATPAPSATVAAAEPTAAPTSPPAAPTSPPAAAAPAAASPQPSPTQTVAAAEPTPSPAPAANAVASPAHAVVAEVRTVTVVKGDNLWDLARHFYGDGLRYADIYTANSAQIRDPNLIYIGQIFVVPQNQATPQNPAAK